MVSCENGADLGCATPPSREPAILFRAVVVDNANASTDNLGSCRRFEMNIYPRTKAPPLYPTATAFPRIQR